MNLFQHRASVTILYLVLLNYLLAMGSASAASVNIGVTATNPVDGTSVTVVSSNNGAVTMQVGQNGGAVPAGDIVTTHVYDTLGNVLNVSVQGTQPTFSFTKTGIYVAKVTITDAGGNPAGTVKITLPISAADVGQSETTTPPASCSLSVEYLTGSFTLPMGSSPDKVTLETYFELPAGFDLSQTHTCAIGLGNVTDSIVVNTDGTTTGSGSLGRIAFLQLRYPQLPPGTTLTSAGMQAAIAITIQATNLSGKGFDAEGISQAGGTAGSSVQRIVESALLLDGTAYRTDIPVNFALSPQGDTGQIRSEEGGPTLNSVTPSVGTVIGGTNVILSGTNFMMGTIFPVVISFGGAKATNVVANSNTSITCAIPAHDTGVVDVVVTNPDGQSGTMNSAFTYIATPSITSTTTTCGTVGQSFNYQITATGIMPITFSAQPLPQGLSLNGATISGMPTTTGTTNVTLGASNSAGSDSTTLQVTINPSGAATITSKLTATTQVGAAFTYKITAVGNTLITFNATNLPSWLSFSVDTLSGTPPVMGTVNVTISASNSLGTDTETLALTINAAGAPMITSSLSQNARAGQSFSYTITATGSGTITFGASPLPAWLTASGNTATLSGTPGSGDVGTFTITLTATNASGTDSKQLQITVAPSSNQPPAINPNDIVISRNPVRTNTNVTFTAYGRSPGGLNLYYDWYYYYGNSSNPDGVPLAGQTVIRSFSQEGTWTVQVNVSDNYNATAGTQKFAVTLAPNSGSDAQNIIALTGTQVINPLGGLGLQVPDSMGGVLNLDVVNDPTVTQDPNESFSTQVPTLTDPFNGSKGAGKFVHPQIFVVETTGTKLSGDTRQARLMVPISGWETGQPPVATDGRKNTGLTSFQLKGKFNFGPKPDSVTLTCAVELPAGMSLNQNPPMPISVGIGNVTGSGSVDSRGRVTGLTSPGNNLKKLHVMWPRLVKKNLVTKAGDQAKLTITLTGSSLHTAGFDTEGIVNTVATGKKGIERQIQTAIVIGGVSYYAQAKATYVYNKDTGQLAGRTQK